MAETSILLKFTLYLITTNSNTVSIKPSIRTSVLFMKTVFHIVLISAVLFAMGCETKRLDEYEVHGIDVSHHQGIINWDKVADQGLDFSFMKATEGQDFQDTLFSRNWEEVRRIGMKRGAYHFFRPKASGLFQAQNFITFVKLQPGDLPPVLDVEVLDGVSRPVLINRMRSWLHIIESHYKVKPIIYTNLKFYHQYLTGNFNDYPIWMARYSYKQPFFLDGRKWSFWQYGNKGRLAGVEGLVDFNVFHGSAIQLDELCLPVPSLFSFLVW